MIFKEYWAHLAWAEIIGSYEKRMYSLYNPSAAEEYQLPFSGGNTIESVEKF